MKKDDLFLQDMQRYIAISAVGPSALRNQGSKGVIKAAQQHLAAVDISRFCVADETIFLRCLDQTTDELRMALPHGAQNWGAARKALNLFLRDICYNRFLCELHDLAYLEDWMEIPLDGVVARAFKRRSKRGELPQWPGLTGLTPEISFEFQAFARRIAIEERITRVHLDMRLWTVERDRGS